MFSDRPVVEERNEEPEDSAKKNGRRITLYNIIL
jgi:hypothetical protein